MSKVEAAIAWARRGFPVFPCFPDEPGHPANAKRAKKPTEVGWTEWATTDEALIRSLWGTNEFNIGCLTTNMLVVDVDTKPGKDGWASWCRLHGVFDTLTVRTPSGGFHVYYAGANVALNQGALGDGLDVRSYHGYTLAPGSTIDGVPYIMQEDRPLVLAPAHIVALCKPPGERAENAHQSLVDEDDAKALLLAKAAVDAAEGGVQGELSEAAYKLACTVRDYGVSEGMCRTLMEPWGLRCAPPVMGADLYARITNAYAYAQNAAGTKHPDVMFSGIVIPPISALLPVNIPTGSPAPTGFGNAIREMQQTARPWVLKRLLLRREVTTLIAPGGVGKSLFQLMTATFLATGLDMFGFANPARRPLRSVIYNAEDDLNEMSMRLSALCRTLGFDAEQVFPYIELVSGKTHEKLRLVQGGQQPSINKEAFGRLIDKVRSAPDVAMLGLDPLNKLHQVNGNDNIAMSFVMEQIEQLAELTDTALLLSHHTSKPNFASTSGYAGNPDAGQGAAAVRDTSRVTMTLMPPSDEDAARFSFTPEERRWYLRLDDAKMNRTMATDETLWLKKHSVTMFNGEDVGGLARADMTTRLHEAKLHFATLFISGMIGTDGSGSITVKAACDILRNSDPLYEKMKVNTVQQRIIGYFTEPFQVPSGEKLCINNSDGTQRLVMI